MSRALSLDHEQDAHATLKLMNISFCGIFVYQGCRLNSDPLSPADHAPALHGSRFYSQVFSADPQQRREPFLDRGNPWFYLRNFCQDHQVNISDKIIFLPDQPKSFFKQQEAAVEPPYLIPCVREVTSDVAQTGGSQEGVN